MTTNCPNCAAAINPYVNRCEYCGTYHGKTTNSEISEVSVLYADGVPAEVMARSYEALARAGQASANEAREMMGLPKIREVQH